MNITWQIIAKGPSAVQRPCVKRSQSLCIESEDRKMIGETTKTWIATLSQKV